MSISRMRRRRPAVLLLGLLLMAPSALADVSAATITSSPAPIHKGKAFEITITTEDLGSPVYLYTWAEGGKVKFSAQNGTVAQTPDEIVSKGPDYTLHATYESRSLDAATTYMLDAEGSSFAATGAAPLEATDSDYDAKADISPFSVYAEAPADYGAIDINIPLNDYVTGVDHIGDDRAGLRIERSGDTCIIYSDKACEIKVFGIDGILVRVLHLSAGANTVDGLRPGIYIMNGVKTVF